MIQNSFGRRRMQLLRMDQLTRRRQPTPAREVETDLFTHCQACGKSSAKKQWQEGLECCPSCGRHTRISAALRISQIMDEGAVSIDQAAEFVDPLTFPGYEEKWLAAAENSGADEAIHFVRGSIEGSPVIFGAMDPQFLMGSMGKIVGDRVVSAFDKAAEYNLPVVIVACSGGARMQEGIISLMQMRRTAEAVTRHRQAGRLFVSVLSDPTTGGVTASFAMLGDIILAEPDALIGFAGPRVIKETIQCDLPVGFQSAEFQVRHGFVDRIVERRNLRSELAQILRLHEKQPEGRQGPASAEDSAVNFVAESASMNFTETGATEIVAIPDANFSDDGASDLSVSAISDSAAEGPVLAEETDRKPTPYERVMLARDPKRKKPAAILQELCTDIVELKGDRCYGDDPALRGGLARLNGKPITYIYIEKGSNLNSQIYHNFGMPEPEGYRKAARLMKQAERFNRPILTIIDTPGAYPGVGAEERGQGEAIASNLSLMSCLSVPLISVITGEAGSGGALAIACSDRLYMLENAVYTILSPEGFATILWKDGKRAEEAAEVMKLTAADMLEYGVCDRVFPDDLSGLEEQLAADLDIPDFAADPENPAIVRRGEYELRKSL